MSLNREGLSKLKDVDFKKLVEYIGVGKLSNPLLKLYKKSGKDLLTKGGIIFFDHAKEVNGIDNIFSEAFNISYFFYDTLINNKSEDPELLNILEGRLRKRLGLDTRDMTKDVTLEEIDEAFKKENTEDEIKNLIYSAFGFKDQVKQVKEKKEENKDNKEALDKNKIKIRKLEDEIKKLQKENEGLRQSKEASNKVRDTNKAKLKDLRDKLKSLANVTLSDDLEETIEKKEKTFAEAFSEKLEEINKAVQEGDFASAKSKLVTLYIEISLEEKEKNE